MLTDLTGGYAREPKADIHGIVHVTGGGIPGKLQRLLKRTGHGAVLNGLFGPSEAMAHVLRASYEVIDTSLRTPDESAYQRLNMGNGALIIAPASEESRIIDAARAHDITCRPAGEIVEEPGIELISRGHTHQNGWIRFEPRR